MSIKRAFCCLVICDGCGEPAKGFEEEYVVHVKDEELSEFYDDLMADGGWTKRGVGDLCRSCSEAVPGFCGKPEPHVGHRWVAMLGDPESASRTCEERLCAGTPAPSSTPEREDS